MLPAGLSPAEATRIILRLGLAGVGVFLVWKLSGSYEADLQAVAEKLERHQMQMVTAQTEQAARDRQSLAMLRAICLGVNVKNPAARALCGGDER